MARSPNLKRIHIVVDRRELEHWRKLADEHYHGRLSQAIRTAMEELNLRTQNEGGLVELRPVIERFDAMERRFDHAMSILENMNKQVEALGSVNQVNTEVLLNAVAGALEEARCPLSTEEVSGKLPDYNIHEVRRGLEILADKFVVEPIKEGERTKWRLVGVGR